MGMWRRGGIWRYLGGRFDGKNYLLEVRVERKGDGKTDTQLSGVGIWIDAAAVL